MITEHDLVALTRDVPEHRLRVGDVGTVVHCYAGGAYEVEFMSAGGETVALVTAAERDVRAISRQEFLHVRERASL